MSAALNCFKQANSRSGGSKDSKDRQCRARGSL